MSATTDLIIRYQEADERERAALRRLYPGYFGPSQKRVSMTATKVARSYAAALAVLLERAGYDPNDVQLIEDRDNVAVTCDIGSLALHGGCDVEIDGHHFDLGNYGFRDDKRVLVEPETSWCVRFYS